MAKRHFVLFAGCVSGNGIKVYYLIIIKKRLLIFDIIQKLALKIKNISADNRAVALR